MRTLKLKTMFCLLSLLMVIASCVHQAEPETHLIPKGYKGSVIIIFDQKKGVPEKYENGSRVYEIPSDGILRTQFKQQEKGFIAPGKLKYYYYDGSRTEIEYLQSVQHVADDGNNHVFSKEISKGTIRYLVGTLNEREKYFQELRSRIDSLFPPQIVQ